MMWPEPRHQSLHWWRSILPKPNAPIYLEGITDVRVCKKKFMVVDDRGLHESMEKIVKCACQQNGSACGCCLSDLGDI